MTTRTLPAMTPSATAPSPYPEVVADRRPVAAIEAPASTYPEDKHLVVHEVRPLGTEAMVILPTVLNRLGAIGRDQEADRAALLAGDVVHLDNGARFMLTARSLYEHDTRKQVTEAPSWYVQQLAFYRGRKAIWLFQQARAQAEFIAQGGEKREEVTRG